MAASERELPEQVDAVLSQDAVSAAQLAQRNPQAPLIHVIHSEVFSIDKPPQRSMAP